MGDRLHSGVFPDRGKARPRPCHEHQEEVALLEANVRLRKGHNLKITAEAQTFDDDTEDRYRGSLVYEYFPWAFVQLRVGIRSRDSDTDDAALNSEEAFVQLHVLF